jgi:hypothetical protein
MGGHLLLEVVFHWMTSYSNKKSLAPDGWVAGWVAGWIRKIVIPLCGPSCKLRFAGISARLKFQDGPSVAIFMARLDKQQKYNDTAGSKIICGLLLTGSPRCIKHCFYYNSSNNDLVIRKVLILKLFEYL